MPGENQDVPRSGARPAAPQLAHNSVRAASATSWRPTPPAPTGQPRKLVYSFFSSVASSDDDSACRSSNPDSGKTRCVACRCSQTPPPTAELPPAYVAWALPASFLWSPSYLNTDTPPRTGVLVKRLPLSLRTRGVSPLLEPKVCYFDASNVSAPKAIPRTRCR